MGLQSSAVTRLSNALELPDYDALRAYAGTRKSVNIIASGIAGVFVRDDADAASADNGGTIIVATNGKRWKRRFEGAVNVLWFGGALASARPAAGLRPLIDPTTGKLWLTADSASSDYTTTRAGMVFQHRDTADGAANELIPGMVNQFNASGNGVVNAATELSQTIWQGQFTFMNKTGDGSAHCYTGIGQLGAIGAGGYNELGLYQGEMTNIGSALGTMSGVEMLLKDSPDGGVNTYSTKMQAVVGRIAKYNPTTRKSFHFYASSEGARYTNGIIGVNPSGNKFQRGFDFEGADFSSGQFGLVPNNTALAWLDSGGAARNIVGVSLGDVTYLRPASNAATLDLQDFGGTTRLQIISASGLVAFQNAVLSAAATAGTNGAPPAQVSGYINFVVNGTQVKMPYYNV